MGIVVRGLTKQFGATRVLDRVSFEIRRGELVALLGPSGGGKSTVLRIIAGLEIPDVGEVLLGGRVATHTRVQDRNIGFVFQGYALFRHLTVRENIAFGLTIRKRPRTEITRAVDELLTLVQLEGLGERYPNELSGGQRQRVALARALAPGTSLLLLDEPFGALDAKVRLDLRAWLRRLHKEREITGVFVTHDQEEAMTLADRVIVMNKGRVEQIGTPEEIYDRPATEFVATFVGSTNVLEGRVLDGHATLGGISLGAAPGAGDGTSVRAFVRPHDVELQAHRDPASTPPPPSGDGPGVSPTAARIERLSRAGGTVKLDLRLTDGRPLVVELTRARLAELGLAEGDWVLVSVRQAKIFVQDYEI
ncbi:sulfate/molybdate ABC transporter ATP-binding protein [Chondromyces apiculatus]|uniref:Sulfate and thiosulfate import ATP-binding protein CysA n=1 Tax=Chondromyces apiculatus DSM 436 TaxID=1192034 RepID=A0A017T0P2_9BACT|nr:sulfate/molybdate ABC transporter ATP-binding protein [Chondromyces apiculatus]EYF02101.1 Sulfate and thiosulfate import ATP-binding protein CysA [Chondromyces apiculatus DSM 436]